MPIVLQFDALLTHNPLTRFLYDGARIADDDTPATLDMEDNGTFASNAANIGLRLTTVPS